MVSNRSLVLNKVDDLSFEDLKAPEISDPHEVLVEVKKTGICGSDIHYYAHGRIGQFVLKKPLVMGHESSGIVSKVGDKVESVKVGDKVAIEPGLPSRLSDEYKSGHYNLCPHMVFAATPSSDGNNPPGTLCKYYKSPEDFLVKLPDHVSLELGALVEPLSVGVHAVKLASITFGENVAVFGSGPVGLLAAASALKFGASSVVLIDIVDSKLEIGKEIGVASHTFNSKTGGSFEEYIKREKLGAIDVVLECSGAEPCIQMGVNSLRPGGRYVQVGNAGGLVKFPITEFSTRELTLFGAFRYGFNDFKTSVKILDDNYKNGKEHAAIDFERIITHRFKFADAIKAYDVVRGGNGCIKCIIDGPE
ncbi:uncharacterized protein PRCAT00003173001 [Priceomyces carsonii]|uniref:uncharacterized protein n=1 Tax=Priceomyces carsonii TaxID=28549 RepID=UPI002ED94433|nr:unnamed protein product [Priceomyces carsonii]